MSFFSKIGSIFKCKTKVAPRVDSNGELIPKPIPSTVPITPPSHKPVQIEDVNWVYPKNWKYIADPDGGKKLIRNKDNLPSGIVIHHTATYSLNSTVNYFKKNAVDVHFLIGHDGEIVQMVQCNKTAAHAGKSEWKGQKWLNNYYIGIEVVSIGWLKKKGDKYYDGYNREWKGKVRARKIQGELYWEPFTSNQEKALRELSTWLCKTYKIPVSNIAAHFEVSPKRKNDPAGGMKVSMNSFRAEIKSLLT